MQLMGSALDVEVLVLPGAGFCRQQRAAVVYAASLVDQLFCMLERELVERGRRFGFLHRVDSPPIGQPIDR